MRTFKIILVGALLIGLVSCSSQVTTVGNPDAPFYTAVLEVTPSFEPVEGSSTLRAKAVVTTWETGNPLYEIFYVLQDFNPETDQGVIDTSNLYKTMWEGRNFSSDTQGNCTAIAEQAITPPFDFGNPPETYTCAFNSEAEDGRDFGGASKEVEETGDIFGLFGFVWAGDHFEYGVLQGAYNTSTEDLSVDIAVWVDYDDEDDYCYRNDIDGNAGTHAFTLRSVKGNRVEGSSFLSVVGKGYSQGADEYFLLKIANNEFPSGRYHCIGADDGEAELQEMAAEGVESPESVDANCAVYQEDVDAMTPFTTADLACESADFNPGGTGTAAEGTIFLDFE